MAEEHYQKQQSVASVMLGLFTIHAQKKQRLRDLNKAFPQQGKYFCKVGVRYDSR